MEDSEARRLRLGEAIARKLRANGDDFTGVQLWIYSMPPQSLKLLTEAFYANDTVEEVDLRTVSDDHEETVGQLVSSFGSLPRLKSLKVIDCRAPILGSLGHVLAGAPSLKTLILEDIRGMGFSGDIGAFSRSLQNSVLTTFRIENCELPDHLKSTMLESLPSSLQKMILSPDITADEIFGPLPVTALVETIAHQLPRLETLHVYNSPDQVTDLLGGLHPNIEMLRDATPLDQDSRKSIASYLHQNIRNLRFTADLSAEDNWNSIADFLMRDNSLQHLHIYLFYESDSEYRLLQVGKALQSHNSTLQYLHLHSFAEISLETLEAFGKCLKTNNSLTNMVPSSPTIALYTKQNRLGRGELLQGPTSRGQWIDRLGQLIDQLRQEEEQDEPDALDCIYCFLSMNPSLCDLEHGIS